MSDVDPTPPASPARRIALRIVGGGLVALLLLLGGLYARGTRVSTAPLDPREPASKPVRQLGQGRDGPRVEAAMVIDKPADEVWAVVTDYAHFGEIFQPPLWTLRVEAAEVDSTRRRLRGEAASRLWRFPIDVTVEHRAEADGSRVASWDSPEAGAVNRGRWVVRPLGPPRTQVLYEAEVRAPGYPAFLVNSLLLAEVGYLLTAVRDRVTPR
jgi:uncharacterized membrane protein